MKGGTIAHACHAMPRNTMQCNAIQCNTTPCNTMQYNAIQCNTMQYNAIQCNTMQYNAIQCNTMQYNTIQCNTMAYGLPWAVQVRVVPQPLIGGGHLYCGRARRQRWYGGGAASEWGWCMCHVPCAWDMCAGHVRGRWRDSHGCTRTHKSVTAARSLKVLLALATSVSHFMPTRSSL